MDTCPIFCAEQIIVPDKLPEILKIYAKEVIKNNPTDIIDFSATYFANLAQDTTTIPKRNDLSYIDINIRS